MASAVFRMMIAALLVAPMASALPLSPLLDPLPTDPEEIRPLQRLQDEVAALECQPAMELPVTIGYGDIIKTRDGGMTVQQQRTVETVVGYDQIPIYGPVERAGVGGLLGPTQRIIGVELVPDIDRQAWDLDIDVKFTERYWDFEEIHRVLLVTPAVGALYPNTAPVVSCSETVLDAVPDFPNEGHDSWHVCIGCTSSSDRDGWYRSILSSEVVRAVPALGPVQGDEWCPTDVLTSSERTADAWAADRGDQGPIETPGASATRESHESQAAAATPVATATGSSPLLLISLAGMVAGAALVALGIFKRD